jgi:hypothetical protein
MKNTPAKIDVILDEHIRISLLSMIEKTNKSTDIIVSTMTFTL